ncbi:MAG TPA: hypothetical protein VF698_10175 [Thermoanaerobaculia bacterium]|jgi:hypothetical protein
MIDTPIPQSGPVPGRERSSGRAALGVIRCALLVTFMMVTPLLVFIPAALFHCGLRYGRRAAWATFALVTMLSVAMMPLLRQVGPENVAVLLGTVAGVMLPSLVVLPMVERGERFGRVLVALLALTAVALCGIEVAMQRMTGFSPYAYQVADAQKAAAATAKAFDLPPEGRAFQQLMIFVLPAFILTQMALIYVLSLMMLGRLRAWRDHAAGRPGSPVAGAYLFRSLALPEWLLFLFVAGGLTPLLHGMLQKIAANVLATVTLLYLLQGLAVIRAVLLAAGVGLVGWLLLALLTLTGLGLPLLGLAGLFDPFFNFRHIKRKDDSHESHTD